MKLRYACLLLIALLGAGCASVPAPRSDCVPIGPSGQICPLPPAALPAVSASHIVTVTRDGQSHTFLGRLHIDHDALRLAGASLFGTHLFTVSWDGHGIVSQPANSKLHPELMVAMLEVALADPAVLRSHLHGLTLEIDSHGDGEVRKLYERGRLVAHIEKHGSPLAVARLTMRIPPVGLTLHLTPVTGEH